ncbi:hypothetical protein GLOTRDRAFT_132875 [Gloeophyllum trabeum ATCC 11539]|uniref:Uncharacterized protein n=1 Tax=Gloeophyllum trabeum (strain ATCC 11539 / FP-39264 / Madison 617) TaxID=670483 RepID=S7PW20_GLOTA|nr:uncharacterized protein GLOTRDRAFT_132875 [Gloeophyllum trabeum ATCC 11539]EPQ51507.1 hypothetical protein GLOTRDRAFT_132875 [Gloeophyllum trabeum ATCC 11539]
MASEWSGSETEDVSSTSDLYIMASESSDWEAEDVPSPSIHNVMTFMPSPSRELFHLYNPLAFPPRVTNGVRSNPYYQSLLAVFLGQPMGSGGRLVSLSDFLVAGKPSFVITEWDFYQPYAELYSKFMIDHFPSSATIERRDAVFLDLCSRIRRVFARSFPLEGHICHALFLLRGIRLKLDSAQLRAELGTRIAADLYNWAVVALMVAHKYMEDSSYSRKSWAIVAGREWTPDWDEIDEIEREFLLAHDYIVKVAWERLPELKSEIGWPDHSEIVRLKLGDPDVGQSVITSSPDYSSSDHLPESPRYLLLPAPDCGIARYHGSEEADGQISLVDGLHNVDSYIAEFQSPCGTRRCYPMRSHHVAMSPLEVTTVPGAPPEDLRHYDSQLFFDQIYWL